MEELKEPCGESPKDLSKTLPEEAFNHFLQGKRNMLVKDYQFAAQSLGTACELYVKHFGELAIECGEVYFMYGKALFRLSQQQASVLGGALNDAGSNEDDNSPESESKENESEKNSEEDGEEGGEDSGDNEKEETEKEPSEEEKEPSESTDSPQAVVDESNEAKDESSLRTPAEVNADSSKEEGNKDKSAPVDAQVASLEEKNAEGADDNQEEEDDLDDLELAWNTLETAKSIFQRQSTVESRLKVAEILELLAEINMESDNNHLAINDLKECLKIQKELLKPDDRILAETYYQMGLALMIEKHYFDAKDNFGMTKKILEVNLENLKNTPVDNKSNKTFASADKELEIAELEKFLHDIQEKVEDTEELIRNEKKDVKNEFSSRAAVVDSGVKENIEGSTAVKPTSNITHLLKRKKPDEAANEGGSKRIKLISVSNGETKFPELALKRKAPVDPADIAHPGAAAAKHCVSDENLQIERDSKTDSAEPSLSILSDCDGCPDNQGVKKNDLNCQVTDIIDVFCIKLVHSTKIAISSLMAIDADNLIVPVEGK